MIGAGALVLPGADVPNQTLVQAGARYPEMSYTAVIAEAGVNHNGDLARARDMVAAAAAAGADIVKFQAFTPTACRARRADRRPTRRPIREKPIKRFVRRLEFSRDDFAMLAEECRRHASASSPPLSMSSMVEALVGMGMDRIKVASGEITNTPAFNVLPGSGCLCCCRPAWLRWRRSRPRSSFCRMRGRRGHHAPAMHVALPGAARRP